MKYAVFLFLGFLFSCSKTDIVQPLIYSEATYKVIITTNWKSPKFVVPAGAHITPVTGMIHKKDIFLWKENTIATQGVEDVAETGNSTKMNSEIDTLIAKYKALSKFEIPIPLINGTTETTIKFTTVFSYISFASMIAPSPDWFLGISNVSLLENNQWVKELILNVKLYDAGTEQGDVFGYNNPATIPQQPVMPLTPVNATVLANKNASLAPMATIRFIKN